jgi:hypothetical protein
MTPLVVIVLLAAELPDAGAPMFPGLCAGYDAFAGGLLARSRRRAVSPLVAIGSIVGFGIGFACWLAALAIDRL